MGLLTKIRQMPDDRKRIFSFVSAGVLTLLIIGLWLVFTPKPPATEESEEVEETLSSISPVQMIKEEFSKAISNFKESVSDDSGQASTTVESTSTIIETAHSTSTGQATTTQ